MVRWTKIVACLAAVLGLAEAAMFGQRSAVVRRVEQVQPADTMSGFANESMVVTDCDALKALRDQTAALFRRVLNKQEYNSRNFMWLRCRADETHLFDMGGTWFGPGGKDLKKHLQSRHAFLVYNFKYVQGNGWGDAILHFVPLVDAKLPDTVNRIRQIAKVAADRYRRTLYIIDCPVAEDDPSWATERAAFDPRWPLEVSNRDKTVAIYGAPPAGPYQGR